MHKLTKHQVRIVCNPRKPDKTLSGVLLGLEDLFCSTTLHKSKYVAKKPKNFGTKLSEIADPAMQTYVENITQSNYIGNP